MGGLWAGGPWWEQVHARTLAVDGDPVRVAAERLGLTLEPAQARLHVKHAPVAGAPLRRCQASGIGYHHEGQGWGWGWGWG